jgi:hypothetical protein
MAGADSPYRVAVVVVGVGLPLAGVIELALLRFGEGYLDRQIGRG